MIRRRFEAAQTLMSAKPQIIQHLTTSRSVSKTHAVVVSFTTLFPIIPSSQSFTARA
ncbi:unnamed protein product [Periconia digitata]|uniref:Uncharacterized protein n=1 Tax=Periconia digitata TaxID=1303443 RepID=A0A9W4U1N4_9PLEO|nr:unnamed protein product [Periconia digitata]